SIWATTRRRCRWQSVPMRAASTTPAFAKGCSAQAHGSEVDRNVQRPHRTRAMSALARLRAEAREMGGLGWTAYVLDRSLARVSRGRARLWALAFYAQPVPGKPILPPARNSKLRVGLVSEGE